MRELGEFKSWRAVRADRRLATTGAQNHDPDTSPCEWQTCFLLPKYLLRSDDLRLGRSHCAMCRGATAQRARFYGTRSRDKTLRHRTFNNWARTSASFAASTGSRDRAEQRHVLSQKDAAGSPSTAVISGGSPEFVGSTGSLTLHHLQYSGQRRLLASFQDSWQAVAAAASDSGGSPGSIQRR
jgi:hypothetical protein